MSGRKTGYRLIHRWTIHNCHSRNTAANIIVLENENNSKRITTFYNVFGKKRSHNKLRLVIIIIIIIIRSRAAFRHRFE